MKRKIFIWKILFIISVSILGAALWSYINNLDMISYLFIAISSFISTILLYIALIRNKNVQ